MRRASANHSPLGVSERRIRRPVATLLAFLLAIAFSPMLLATGPASAAQDTASSDLTLVMDANGVVGPGAATVYSGGTLTYTITVSNEGPDENLGATVSGDIILWAATFVSANVSGNVPDPDPSNNFKNSYFTILPGAAPDADLSVTKTVDNPTPSEGDTIVYIVKTTNFWRKDATGVTIRDDGQNVAR